MCGTYSQYCAPSPYESQDTFSAVTSGFGYTGPTPSAGKVISKDVRTYLECVLTSQSGVFFARETYYVDPDCDRMFLDIKYEGAMAYVGTWPGNAVCHLLWWYRLMCAGWLYS